MQRSDEQALLGLGHWLAPPRFLFFMAVFAATTASLFSALGWRASTMAGFDAGALAFLLSCLPMLRHESDDMRRASKRNDANRLLLLLVTGAVSLVVLVAVASELMDRNTPHTGQLVLIVGTLALSWTFSNTIFALHYAHLYYASGKNGDAQGLDFPETPEPDYWDFVYFAFCLGMTFQTSDVDITQGRLRRPVTLHCLLAFVFNLGIVAFTINVLGGSS
jgi:uncharacterized membrane protein